MLNDIFAAKIINAFEISESEEEEKERKKKVIQTEIQTLIFSQLRLSRSIHYLLLIN